MSVAEKLTIVAKNVPRVYTSGYEKGVTKGYADGQKSMIDESKIIKKSSFGIEYICVGDVSEVPHTPKLTVSDNHIGNIIPYLNTTVEDGVVTQIEALEDEYPNPTTKIIGVKIDGTIVVEATNTGITMGLYSTPFKLTNDYKEIRFGLNGKHKDTIVSIDPTRLEVGQCYILSVNFTNITQGTISWQDMSIVRASEEDSNTPLIDDFTKVIVKRYGEEYTDGTFETESTVYSLNEDGIVEIPSISPIMTLTSDIPGLRYDLVYHKSWGMQYEYDTFWNNFQNNGNRTNYHTAFARNGWKNNTTYRPKYPIVCGGSNTATSMFSYSGVKDTLVPITISGNNNSVFYGAGVVTINQLDLSGVTSGISDWFTSCTNLANIVIVGEIPVSVNFKDCPLTAKSLVSIVEALSSAVSEKTLTVKVSAVNNADWSTTRYASWDELIATKTNWTFSLV